MGCARPETNIFPSTYRFREPRTLNLTEMCKVELRQQLGRPVLPGSLRSSDFTTSCPCAFGTPPRMKMAIFSRVSDRLSLTTRCLRYLHP